MILKSLKGALLLGGGSYLTGGGEGFISFKGTMNRGGINPSRIKLGSLFGEGQGRNRKPQKK